jgi:TM2 domain-containing membrane protein YozV
MAAAEPTMIEPAAPIQPEIVEPEVIPPPAPAPQYKAPEPVYTAPQPTQPPSNRGLAVAVEIIAGIFGFLGIGWMIAGKLGWGIGLLIGYWIGIAIYAVILTLLSPFTLGLSFFGFCCLPIFPVISGLVLNNQMQ